MRSQQQQQQQQVLRVFLDQLTEFVQELVNIYPEEVNIRMVYNGVKMARKGNPRMLPDMWYRHVVVPYEGPINEGNFEYFLLKDYTEDVYRCRQQGGITGVGDGSGVGVGGGGGGGVKEMLSIVDTLRGLAREMNEETRETVMKYVKVLSKLSSALSAATAGGAA